MNFSDFYFLLIIVALFILAGISIGLYREIRAFRIWERKRFAQEFLNTFVTGEFPIIREKLEKVQDCRVWQPDDSYAQKIKTCSQERVDEIDTQLKKILNILEGLCINIHYDILDEDICYNYLGWLVVAYHRWSAAYIKKLRDRADDRRIYIHFSEYAGKWADRIEREEVARK